MWQRGMKTYERRWSDRGLRRVRADEKEEVFFIIFFSAQSLNWGDEQLGQQWGMRCNPPKASFSAANTTPQDASLVLQGRIFTLCFLRGGSQFVILHPSSPLPLVVPS
jgi:hypothetical protein